MCAWQQAKQAQEAAAKAAEKASGEPSLQLQDDDAEDLDPNLYYERRVRGVANTRAAGATEPPFPSSSLIAFLCFLQFLKT